MVGIVSSIDDINVDIILLTSNFTYCNCGIMPGSAEWGVMGVIGEGVEGPMVGVTPEPVGPEPPKLTIGLIMVCC